MSHLGPHIVGLGGTTRPQSSSESAMSYVLACAEEQGATVTTFDGGYLATLPIYDPGSTQRSMAAEELVTRLRRADGIIIASPAYHGAVSGLVKNALDYVEDMRDDDRPYFDGLPVGCIVTGAGWQAIVATLLQLRTIAHALRGWPTPFGVALNSLECEFYPSGEPKDDKSRRQLQSVAEQVLSRARHAELSLAQAG
jgi:FMN reductase